MQDCFSTACCCESGTSAGGQLGNKRKSQLNCTGREAYPSSQMPWAEFMPIPGSESAEDLHTMGKAPEFVLMRKETSSSPPEPQNRVVCLPLSSTYQGCGLITGGGETQKERQIPPATCTEGAESGPDQLTAAHPSDLPFTSHMPQTFPPSPGGSSLEVGMLLGSENLPEGYRGSLLCQWQEPCRMAPAMLPGRNNPQLKSTFARWHRSDPTRVLLPKLWA